MPFQLSHHKQKSIEFYGKLVPNRRGQIDEITGFRKQSQRCRQGDNICDDDDDDDDLNMPRYKLFLILIIIT